MSAWRAWYESWLQAIRITSRGKASEQIGIVSPEVFPEVIDVRLLLSYLCETLMAWVLNSEMEE